MKIKQKENGDTEYKYREKEKIKQKDDGKVI